MTIAVMPLGGGVSLGALGAADDPWIVMDADIKGEIGTLSAVVSSTNSDIQENKRKFSNRDLRLWHEFVEEWLAWKKTYLEGGTFRATSGAWIKVKAFKERALEWVTVVQKRLGLRTPGLPKPPLRDKEWWGSAMAWGFVGVIGLVSAGYFVRSFGVASIARSKAAQRSAKAAKSRAAEKRK